jgi:DNA-binding GntR family transcriptional regulator
MGVTMPEQEPKAESLTRRVYLEIRQDILACRFMPEQRLHIGDLKNRFDTSLSVIREALARLSTEGLVDAIDQRGFRAASVSPENLEDLIRTRRQIEGLALRQAIKLGDLGWEMEIRTSYADLVRQDQLVGVDYGKDPDWIAAHENYHRALIRGCNSLYLVRLCQQFAELTQRYRLLARSAAPHRHGSDEHEAIFQAVLERDADKAVAVLDNHFATTASILLGAYSFGSASGPAQAARSQVESATAK